MPIDEIKRKIDRLSAYLNELKPHLELADKVILADQMKLRNLERLFQLIVDEAVDINSMLATDSSLESPESYRSTFYSLVNLKIIDENFADKISQSAKLRNQVVHEYEQLKPSEVVRGVKFQFPLFREYLTILINKFIG